MNHALVDIDSHEPAAIGAADRDPLEQIASQLAGRLAARPEGSR